MVAVRGAERLEGLATVATPHEVDIGAIDRLFVDRINEDLGVIPGPLADIIIIGLERPGCAGIR